MAKAWNKRYKKASIEAVFVSFQWDFVRTSEIIFFCSRKLIFSPLGDDTNVIENLSVRNSSVVNLRELRVGNANFFALLACHKQVLVGFDWHNQASVELFKAVPSINVSNIKRCSWKHGESNPGLLCERQLCYLCAMLSKGMLTFPKRIGSVIKAQSHSADVFTVIKKIWW